MLGLEADRARQRLVTRVADVPTWAGTLRMSGVRAFGRTWEVRLEDGRASVDET
jgi:hypothetical protein